MSDFKSHFANSEFVTRYVKVGPPAFMPGHAGVLQMIGVLLNEKVPETGNILVVGAGGGLDTKAMAEAGPKWNFVGVDPAPKMLDLAREIVGAEVNQRLELIEGSVDVAPAGPFDAATLILVLGIIPDDGAKLALLSGIRERLKPNAPFILVDRCVDSDPSKSEIDLERYVSYARASGVDEDILATARASQLNAPNTVSPERDEEIMREAGFHNIEVFYVGMSWRGWVAYVQ